MKFDFESSIEWTPRMGITITNEKMVDLTTILRISGVQKNSMDYAVSKDFTITPGKKYQLSGMIKVDSSSSKQFPPCFRIELLGIKGNYITNQYDYWYGGWQELSVQFQCPLQAIGAWIGLHKGRDSLLSIGACIDNIVLVEIDQFNTPSFKFPSLPSNLLAVKDIHPRLYLSNQSIDVLGTKLNTEPYNSLFTDLLKSVDRWVKTGPPEYKIDADVEQVWQREVGNAIPNLALSYLLTQDELYLTSAKKFMLASAGYPTWGLGAFDCSDLAAGHQLYGLALGYDWLYGHLDATTRDSVHRCLEQRGKKMFSRLVQDSIEWSILYLQNHLWVNLAGLSTAAFALFGENPDVEEWIVYSLNKFRRSIRSFGSDGASHEGIGYWEYGLEYLLKYMELAKTLLGENLYAENEWMRNTAFFRIYSMLPLQYCKEATSMLMTFSDGNRWDWYGPDHLLRRLAAEYKNGNAQWLAQTLDSLSVCVPTAPFLNLLWVDPSVACVPPNGLPTSKHFKDLDIVFLRSGWDGRENVSGFKCGPFIGHCATERYSYDPGGSHVHPDAASFQIHASGDWLIAGGMYSWKATEYHNTVVVNGIGQIGSGSSWFAGKSLTSMTVRPRIVYTSFNDSFDYIIGEAGPAYPSQAHLQSFVRHFLYVKPDVWLIGDEIATDTSSKLEFYFHSDFCIKPVGNNRFCAAGKQGSVDIQFFGPSSFTTDTCNQLIRCIKGDSLCQVPVVRVTAQQSDTTGLYVSSFAVRPTNQEPTIKINVDHVGITDCLTIMQKTSIQKFTLVTERVNKYSPLFVPLEQINAAVKKYITPQERIDVSVVSIGVRRAFLMKAANNIPVTFSVYNTKGSCLWTRSGVSVVGGSDGVYFTPAPGMYFIRMSCTNVDVIKKMIIY